MPVGYQEYIVLGRETQVFEFLQYVATQEPSSSLDETHMESVVTLTATADAQMIYYDHWEDGYDPGLDPQSPGFGPTQPTTETHGPLLRGQVLSLNSDGPQGPPDDVHNVVPVDPMSARGTVLRYDGGDRVISQGGPIDLAHNMWPENEARIGGAWEMYARQAMTGFHNYIIPIGEDSYLARGGDTGSFAPFQYMALQVSAFEDDTLVVIDNGTDLISLTLDMGEIYSTRGFVNDQSVWQSITVLEGTNVTSNKDIQVGILTGSDAGAGASYQTRFFNAIPIKAYGRDYVIPILGDNTSEVNIYLFNPNQSDVTVTIFDAGTPAAGLADTLPGLANPASSATSWIEITGAVAPPARTLAAGGGARVVADAPIWGVVAYDYTRVNRDWGFSLVPSRYLNEDYFVSWSPNRDPPQANVQGNPVWVTPARDATTIWVDFDPLAGNGPDPIDLSYCAGTNLVNSITLNTLEVEKIYDCSDGDNTGTRIFADGPLALSYGQDDDSGVSGASALDLGYTVLPLTQDFLDPVLTIEASAAPTSVDSGGGQVQVALTVSAGNFDGITDIYAWLELSDQVSYDAIARTTVTLPDSSSYLVDPIITSLGGGRQRLFWDLNEVLDANQTLTLVFNLSWNGTEPDGVYDMETGVDASYISMELHPTDTFEVIKTFIRVTKAVDQTSAGVGEQLMYTLTVDNTAPPTGPTAQGVVLVDYLHEGLSFDSADPGCSYDAVTRSVSCGPLDIGPNGSVTFQFWATVALLPEGTRVDNTATAAGIDSVTLNPIRADSNMVYTDVIYPILQVVKRATPMTVVPADTVAYDLTIRNLGAVPALNVVVRDPIPNDTTYMIGVDGMWMDIGSGPVLQTDAIDADFCDYDGTEPGGVAAVIPSLAGGAEYTMTFTVTVNAAIAEGTEIGNQASIEASNALSRLSNVVLVTYPLVSGCTNDGDCDDNVGCTDDVCNVGLGTCSNTPNPANCDDNAACTTDACDPNDPNADWSGCVITPVDATCDDGQDCSADTCDPTDPAADANGCLNPPLPLGTLCRGSAGVCDPAEVCDGTSPACPPDAKDSTTVCRPSQGACDPEEICDGLANDCPPDAKDSTTVCRLSQGACDLEEICDGLANDCPPDAKDSTTVCRPSQGVCDVEEVCDGVSDDCAENSFASPGAACDDGQFCTETDGCDGLGACVGTGNPCAATSQVCNEDTDTCEICLLDADCDDLFSCTADVCNAGACFHTPDDGQCDDGIDCTQDACDPSASDVDAAGCVHVPQGADCDDGVFCNGAESCDALLGCQPGSDPCEDGVDCTQDACDEVNDSCTQTPDDTLCDDQDVCTLDSCVPETGCANVFQDADADGTCDADDPCPEDPQDLCVSCQDTDSDGTCDDQDPCPNDPEDQCIIWNDSRVQGGGCGCGMDAFEPAGLVLMLLMLGGARFLRWEI